MSVRLTNKSVLSSHSIVTCLRPKNLRPLIVGWNMLTCSIKTFIDSSKCSNTKNISPAYLHQIIGFLSKFCNTFYLKSAMKIKTKEGANLILILIVALGLCLKVFPSNSKCYFWKILRKSCQRITWDFFLIPSFQKPTKRRKTSPCGMLE